MKLWILKARDGDFNAEENPWEMPYDKNFGLVIRAESEERARELAQAVAQDEALYCNSPWLDAKYSTCNELSNDGSEDILLINSRMI
ncbi:hypothetical protein RN053_00570 [Pantoea dispersa]|uniref:hypothetical protein n=1 Tax=Pantoea dispersa TaxID=59814 RepID=UPI0028E09EE7|nr:hypothetical protein [Pantoea dispersa]MDT8848970.1 hypothetical protein [Pantoea dispersa]